MDGSQNFQPSSHTDNVSIFEEKRMLLRDKRDRWLGKLMKCPSAPLLLHGEMLRRPSLPCERGLLQGTYSASCYGRGAALAPSSDNTPQSFSEDGEKVLALEGESECECAQGSKPRSRRGGAGEARLSPSSPGSSASAPPGHRSVLSPLTYLSKLNASFVPPPLQSLTPDDSPSYARGRGPAPGLLLPKLRLSGLTPTRAPPRTPETGVRARERVPQSRVRRVPPLEARCSEPVPAATRAGVAGWEGRPLAPSAAPQPRPPVGGALSGPPLRALGPARPAPARWALDGRLASASATPAASGPQPRRHHAQPGPLPQPDVPHRADTETAPQPPTPGDAHLGGSSRRGCRWDRCRRLRRPQRRRPHWRRPPRPFSSSRRRPPLSCQWLRLRDCSRFPLSPF